MRFVFDFHGKTFGLVDNARPCSALHVPCALESRAHALEVSVALKEIFAEAGVSFICKSSFDKANSSSGASFRGVGNSPRIVHSGRGAGTMGVPVLTDVHAPDSLHL